MAWGMRGISCPPLLAMQRRHTRLDFFFSCAPEYSDSWRSTTHSAHERRGPKGAGSEGSDEEGAIELAAKDEDSTA